MLRMRFGGLSNTLSRSLTPLDKCYRMENATVERGILEARPGMRMMYDGSLSTSDVTYGFGYGRWGDTEKYLLFVKHDGDSTATLYSITPGNTATYVAGGTASYHHASKWSMAQHDQYIYAGNATDGLWRYSLSDGTWGKVATTFQSVVAPESDVSLDIPPTNSRAWNIAGDPDDFHYFFDSTHAVPDDVLTEAVDDVYLTFTNDHAIDCRMWFIAEFQGANVPDWRNGRYLGLTVRTVNSEATPETRNYREVVQLTDVAGAQFATGYKHEFYWTDDAGADVAGDWTLWYKGRASAVGVVFGSIEGSSSVAPPSSLCSEIAMVLDMDAAGETAKLDAVAKIAVGVPLRVGDAGSIHFSPLDVGAVWLNKVSDSDKMTDDPADDYTCQSCEYAVVNWDGAEESSSTLYTLTAEDATGEPYGPNGFHTGARAKFSLPAPTPHVPAVGVPATRLYRRRRSASDVWYLIDSNTTAGAVDKYDSRVDAAGDGADVAGNPEGYWGSTTKAADTVWGSVTQDILPECMCAWKTHLVCGVAKEIYFSRAMNPSQFVLPLRLSSTTGVVDTSDATQGRTLYMAQDQSDTVTALIGQDMLYAVGRRGTYAMAGDSAVDATPTRLLPNSRGCANAEAAIGYDGGVLVGSKDGLWFYRANRASVSGADTVYESKELTEDVRLSWKYLYETYPDNPLIVAEREGEIWAFRGPRYMRLTKSGRWEEGKLTEAALDSGTTGGDGWDYPTPGDGSDGGTDYPDPDDPPVGGGEDDDGSDDPVVTYTCTTNGWTLATAWTGNWGREMVDPGFAGISDAGEIALEADASKTIAAIGAPVGDYSGWVAVDGGNIRITCTRATSATNASCKISIGLDFFVHVTDEDVESVTLTAPTALTQDSGTGQPPVGNPHHSDALPNIGDWASAYGTLTFSLNFPIGTTSAYKDIPFDYLAEYSGSNDDSSKSATGLVTVTAAAAIVACDTAVNY